MDFESLLFVKSPLFVSGQDFFVLFLLAIRFITFSLKSLLDRFVLAILIFNLSLESLFLFAISIADLSPVSLFLFAILIIFLSLVSLFKDGIALFGLG